MKKNNSTQELIGVKSFSRSGLATNKGELIFFLIKPTNISVLSKTSIELKIQRLTQLLSAHPDIEIVCTDARENFNENKLYLSECGRAEKNAKVRQLLASDRAFLDDIQIQMSTSREFMFVVRMRNESEEQSFASLNRIEKLINEQGFECRRAGREDIKRIISRYFGTSAADREIEDTDGESVVSKWFLQY
jgi:hypothetical protein